VLLAVFAFSPVFVSGCGQEPGAADGSTASDEETGFAELQARGAEGMGVDQYASTHLFDALDDGGRIELQYHHDDPDAIETIRNHLREIEVAFSAGDFSTPAFVHAREVPGTDVMAARRNHIAYSFEELERGGALRIVTTDPQALAAIREFMAFQRDDHRAGGVDHGSMHHGTMGHDTMHHGAMGHDTMRHGDMDHGAMDHCGMDHGTMHHGQGDHGTMHRGQGDHGAKGGMMCRMHGEEMHGRGAPPGGGTP